MSAVTLQSVRSLSLIFLWRSFSENITQMRFPTPLSVQGIIHVKGPDSQGSLEL